ncbi:uncharacterized protein LOC115884062 [Sitophilus oryzae]|uniref:Uncharacterized protein LOC115884062 n=1 Tax=Sitophilus oryzae TaxID=7048 RepID=A0A6J2Y3I8_SITOR|nr:uncharacterized protein LOC115884062 [Sitophilus oryzae]
MIFKLKHGDIIKWCKAPKLENKEEFMNIVYTKFPQLQGKTLTFVDKDGIELEEDFLFDYLLSSNEQLIQVILTEKNEFINLERASKSYWTGASTCTTITEDVSSQSGTSTSSFIIDDSNILRLIDTNAILTAPTDQTPPVITNEIPAIRAPGKNISSQELRELLENRNCKTVFMEYEKLNFLTTSTRKILVNMVVDIMFERHGYNVPTHIKTEYAKAIVDVFPKLKDPCSPGGYEAFFNPDKHEGFLAWRIKTVLKSTPSLKRTRKRKGPQDLTENPVVPEKKSNCDIEETIDFLNNCDPRNDREVIFEKMQLSFEQRRDNPDIAARFLRFFDTPGLLEQDFSLLYPGKPTLSECLPLYIDRILEVYEAITPQSSLASHIALPSDSDEMDVWNQETRALLAILYMLPPSAKGKKGRINDTLATAEKKLLQFKQINIPLSEIIEVVPGSPPFLIAEGESKCAVGKFHIYLDGRLIPCKDGYTFLEAFDALFMAYYVFNLKYDESLHPFFTFLESFFYKIGDEKKLTPKLRELRSRLTV